MSLLQNGLIFGAGKLYFCDIEEICGAKKNAKDHKEA